MVVGKNESCPSHMPFRSMPAMLYIAFELMVRIEYTTMGESIGKKTVFRLLNGIPFNSALRSFILLQPLQSSSSAPAC